MIQFFARVVELREGKIAFASESVKCDGKITMDFPSREFLEVTFYSSDPQSDSRFVSRIPTPMNRSVRPG